MPELTPEEQYQKDYDEAMLKLEAADAPAATTAPADKEPVEKTDPPAADPDKTEPTQPVETIEELKARLARAEKLARDNQAWGTQKAQEAAELRRKQRELEKPELLVSHPELEQAIRYATEEQVPAARQEPTEEERNTQWTAIIDKAHPGLFALPDTDELVLALKAKREELGEDWNDPLVAIREITAVKLAHNERQIGRRFAQQAAELSRKNAMTVPGAGGSAARTATTDDEALKEQNRILNMSDADFAKEVKRVKGY